MRKAPSTRWHEWAKLFAGLESASDIIELLTKKLNKSCYEQSKKIGQLDVAIELADFINEELLPKIERDEKQFWMGFEKIIKEFSPRNAGLLSERRSCSLKLIHGIKSKRPRSRCCRIQAVLDRNWLS